MRNKRQEEFADLFIKKGSHGILNLVMRFGKIRTSLLICQKLNVKSVLICYPINTIKDSWEADFIKWEYRPENVEYCNYISLNNIIDNTYDLVILDEVHDTSEKQRFLLKELLVNNKKVLGLSGSINDDTEIELIKELGLFIVGRYGIEIAIKEGMISNYEIKVITMSLDDQVKYIQPSKKINFKVTEQQRYDYISRMILDNQIEGKDCGLLPIQRMNIIKNSIAKRDKTKELVKELKDDRVIFFCGVTKIADSLGIPVYHSKKREDSIFNDFKNGKGNHLAVIDLATTGVTITPIQYAVFNYFSSNSEDMSQKIARLIGLEYNNINKVAKVLILCTDTVEKKWLTKALEMFDQTKIEYL